MYKTLRESLENTMNFNKENNFPVSLDMNIEIYINGLNRIFNVFDSDEHNDRKVLPICRRIFENCENLEKELRVQILDSELYKIEIYYDDYTGNPCQTLLLKNNFDIEEWTDKYYEMYLNDDNVFSSQDLLKETTYVCHKKTGKLGKSKCHSVKDYFDSELGYAIAYARAIGDEVPQEILMGDC